MKSPSALLPFFALALGVLLVRCDGQDLSEITGPPLPTDERPLTGASCVPGQTLACQGVCGVPLGGYQVCAEDGASYGECTCPDREVIDPPANPDPERNPMPPVVTFPQEPRPQPGARRGSVGAACESDGDCASGLSCFGQGESSLGVGGPAGGYCTRPCNGGAECSRVDPDSACASLLGQSVCARTCQSRDPEDGEAKCLAREDLTCLSLAALGQEAPGEERQLGICAPRCQSDAACGDRFCDPVSGVCVDQPPSGAPIGAACEEAVDCAGGLCLSISAEAGEFCSAFCTLGVSGCGHDGSGSAETGCFLSQVPGEGPGDSGLCFELCDEDVDCLEPGSLCVPSPFEGRAGVCVRPLVPVAPPPDPDPPEPPGPDAGDVPGGSTGLPCETDADCGGTLSCFVTEADDFGLGGGPAGGYCTEPCDDAPCSEPGAVCLNARSGAFCFGGCNPADARACGGRENVVCDGSVLQDGSGFCRPQCAGNEVCSGGTCNAATGLCHAGADCATNADCGDQICDALAASCVEPPPGLGLGQTCAEDADCAGEACVTLPGGAAPECTAACLLGTARGCEAYGRDAFCLLPANADGTVGVCLELCNEASECTQPGYECAQTGGLLNGRTGACLPPAP